jgi:hypothetical protein
MDALRQLNFREPNKNNEIFNKVAVVGSAVRGPVAHFLTSILRFFGTGRRNVGIRFRLTFCTSFLRFQRFSRQNCQFLFG